MSDNLHEAATAATDAATSLLLRLDQLAASTDASSISSAMFRVEFLDRVGNLTTGFALLAIGWYLCRMIARKVDDEVEYFLATIVVAASTCIPAGALLLNIWNWIGLFDPRASLAHKMIDSVFSR